MTVLSFRALEPAAPRIVPLKLWLQRLVVNPCVSDKTRGKAQEVLNNLYGKGEK